ncbi:MAG: flippase-like domain-containing protein [Firmicutes bacterium]|nr:flippase-like domain-containing protein [Bacillota bacterium]
MQQAQKDNRKPGAKNKLFFFFLRLFISAAVIIILLKSADTGKIAGILKNSNILFIIPGFFCILSGAFPSALAWKILLDIQGMKVSFLKIAYFNLVGFFFNTYLPTGVGGDVWRGYAIIKEGDGSPGGAASFVAERFLALGAIITLGAVSFLFRLEQFRQAGIMNSMLIFLGILITGFIIAFVFGNRIIKLLKKIVSKFFPGLKEYNIEESLSVYGKNPGKTAAAYLLSFLSPLLECAAFIFIIHALNLSAPVFAVFILVPLLRFINHLPVSYSSIGTQDITLILFWQPLGLTSAEAMSISVLMHALRLSAGLTGGALYVLFPPSK